MFRSDFIPQKVYLEEGSQDYPLTERILKKLEHVPREIIRSPQDFLETLQSSRDMIGEGKKCLFLTRQKGEFVKPCPCTPHHISCHYFIINLDLNCPLDCTYCILQHYLSNPLLTIHVNHQDLWEQLGIFCEKNKHRKIRIGTGELGDSLALDHLTENSRDLISYFRLRKNTVLELKTKTTNIQNILDLEPAENIVISWSLNSSKMAQEEEKGAAPVEQRIEAARVIVEKGFPVGFHFDPLIRCPGWDDDYAQVVKKLLRTVPPARIQWISLGSLRFSPLLKPIIQLRFPQTKIIYDELVPGKDGKLRYFRPLRLELYQRMIGFIQREGGKNIPLYLCMETEEIWRETLKKTKGKGIL
jgi:spore photoproduct lyase